MGAAAGQAPLPGGLRVVDWGAGHRGVLAAGYLAQVRGGGAWVVAEGLPIAGPQSRCRPVLIATSGPVRRLVDRGVAGRERSESRPFTERGGYRGYAMWRRYLALAHGYTASHKDGIVKYTAHETPGNRAPGGSRASADRSVWPYRL